MPCPRCGSSIAPEALFCDGCGNPLESTCRACGTTNRPGARFCKRCGEALTAPLPTPGAGPTAVTPRSALASPAALEGERKQVTVLFADIKGSMELLADRDPEEARALLDPLLSGMMEAVRYHGGTVNQVLGDGIMALFGAPLAYEDHAVRACYAALRMQESVARHAREEPALAGITVQLRVGLNSGEVVVRAIGSDLHMDYTAVGQTTHLAARMEQAARAGTVLATASTVEMARGYVEVRALGPTAVKGVETPVEVYEIVGTTAARSRLQAAAGRLSPFVGRTYEMGVLLHALERGAAGQGQVVTVTGEPGVGKSRLLHELTRSPAVAGWQVLRSVAVPHGKVTAFLPVADLLRRHLEVEPADDAAAVRARVAAALHRLPAGTETRAEPLAALLDALPADSPFLGLEPAERRRQMLEAVRRLLVATSRLRPLLLVLENLESVDSQTLALLDALVEVAGVERIVLLASFRPEHEVGWSRHRFHVRLRLEPLARADARALLDALLGRRPELDAVKQLVLDRIGGNPFFLEETVRDLVGGGVLVGEPGDRRRHEGSPTVQLPATVQAAVAARIDRLAPADKRLLQTAAVMGREVPGDLVAAVSDLGADELTAALGRLEAGGFLQAHVGGGGLEYVFAHALTQEVAYASLLLERRRRLHARVMEALQRQPGEPGAERLGRLVHHALRGEVWAGAVDFARRAGGRAAATGANAEAATFLEQALRALERMPETPETLAQAIDVRLELRSPLLQLGRLNELLSRSMEAERLARQLGDDRRLADVYTYLINYHYLRGEPPLALEYSERCLAIARRRGDRALEALATRYVGHIQHARGQYREARQSFERNLALVETAGDEGPSIGYAAAAAWLALTLAELGEFPAADAGLDRAETAAGRDGHPYSQAMAWTMRGLVRLRQGRVEEALPTLERAVEMCRARQLTIWEPIPLSGVGLALTLLGRKDQGLRLLERGVGLTEELGVKACLALWVIQLGQGLLEGDEGERARETAARALELAGAHRERGHEAWASWLAGEAMRRRRPPDAAGAVSALSRALELARELGMRPLEARCHLALGHLHLQSVNRARAEEHLALATALLFELGLEGWLEEARQGLAQLGRLIVVARPHTALHAWLERACARDGKVQVVLDRRQGGAAAAGLTRPDQESRQRLEVDLVLRDRVLVVIE